MLLRYRSTLLLFALLIGTAGTGAGQDKKDDPKKKPDGKLEEMKKDDDPKKEAAKKADEGTSKRLQDYANAATGETISFKSADGVKLAGVFYKAMDGSKPVVLMLHDYKAGTTDAAWDDTAKLCLARGFNVLRFDFRGHGKSTEVVPGDFWVRPENRTLINGGSSPNVSAKTTIKVTEFKPNYFPMLVQDIAAARNYLDQQNDSGILNTSTVYLLGSGDAAGLGFLYMASEWSRERHEPGEARFHDLHPRHQGQRREWEQTPRQQPRHREADRRLPARDRQGPEFQDPQEPRLGQAPLDQRQRLRRLPLLTAGVGRLTCRRRPL